MEKKKLVFATNNRHKADEIRRMVGADYEILTLSDIGCDEEIEENADTLEGNAEIKARYVKEHYGYDCFADDTGLEVDALGGEPGVMSARYAGPGHDSKANMSRLLREMNGMTDRSARFRTVIALITGDRLTLMDGVVNGEITVEPSGSDGFGYDPVFRPEGSALTFAEMSPEAKNAISHRGRATAKLIDYLSKLK
ncbi:MAG: non-canonical purine NTP diphosphatase [Muribaculaceae bacterium]|nr:non-canonical purine NTP diphosphatase [Muribaculaceae bacterium]